MAEEIGGHAYVADLADVGGTRDVMERAIGRLGGLDVLVNNAGVMRFSALLDMEPAELGDAFALGTRAMLITTQVAARAMIAFRTPSADCAGKVINVAGVCGTARRRAGALRGGQGGGHGADEGVRARARPARHHRQLPVPRLRARRHGPARLGPGRADPWSALSPLGRLADPEDIARAALFLASSDSDYLTGDALNVSGGMALH